MISFRFAALLVVATASIASYGRVFRGTSWLLPMLAACWLGASLAFWLTARSRVIGVVSSLVIGVWFLTLVLFPEDIAFLFPTSKAISRLFSSATDGYLLSLESIAPQDPLIEYLALLMPVCWAAAVASAALLRTSARALAPVIWIIVFEYAAAVGTNESRLAYMSFFVTAIIAYFFVDYQTGRTDGPEWTKRVWAQLGHATPIAGVALIGALVIPGILPGFQQDALAPWAQLGPGSRVELSPLVQIRPRLTDSPLTEVFRVTADEPAYWRIASLDHFDGSSWSLKGEFGRQNGPFRFEGSPSLGRPLDQVFRISGLGGSWVPAAFAPSEIQGLEVLADQERGILIVDKELSPVSYKVRSILSSPSPDRLRAASPGSSSKLKSLPELHPEVIELTRQLTANAPTAYDKAVAIQNFLRGFTYSEDVAAGHSEDYLATFLLETRVGYCEQFATAMAAMLRLSGIPSRVAVGFLPGNEAGGEFIVSNRDAHAWPEAAFEGIGWVAFEPTPRADAEPPTYATGESQPAEPVDPAPEQTTTPEPVPTTAQGPENGDLPAAGAGGRTTTRILLIAGLMVGLLPIARETSIRANRAIDSRRGGSGPNWFSEFYDRASAAFRLPDRSETELEFTGKASGTLRLPSAPVRILLFGYLRTAYGPRPRPPANPAALTALKSLRAAMFRGAQWRGKLRYIWSPRPIVRLLQRLVPAFLSMRRSSAARRADMNSSRSRKNSATP